MYTFIQDDFYVSSGVVIFCGSIIEKIKNLFSFFFGKPSKNGPPAMGGAEGIWLVQKPPVFSVAFTSQGRSDYSRQSRDHCRRQYVSVSSVSQSNWDKVLVYILWLGNDIWYFICLLVVGTYSYV